MDKKYNELLKLLQESKNNGSIKLLYRGVSTKFAFDKFKLDTKCNTINQFSERLFFYGEKSKYFWDEKLNTSEHKFKIELNEVSDNLFKYIFLEFNQLINKHKKEGTARYFKKSKETVSFFKNDNNIDLFIRKIRLKSQSERRMIRNYYLRILHQLGESNFKKQSNFVSSSEERSVAQKFSRSEIIINFWDLNFSNHPIQNDIPIFNGKPYKNQKEISVFAVILPHYIHSFKFKGKVYPNPAINNTENLSEAIFGGLDIQQENFDERLGKETNYKSGAKTDDLLNYEEIKKSP